VLLSNPHRILEGVDHDVLRVRGGFLDCPSFQCRARSRQRGPALLTGVSAQGWKGGDSFNFIFMHNIIDYLPFSLLYMIFAEHTTLGFTREREVKAIDSENCSMKVKIVP
jgi:hypothetical protein